MTYQLPKRRVLVHKAIEPRNLSAKVKAVVDARVGDNWEIKYDGVHCIIVISGDAVLAFSRQGEVVNGSMNHVLAELKAEFHAHRINGVATGGAVIFCEAWHPEWSHQKINGTFRRGADGSELEAVCWDMIPLVDFEAGHCAIPFRTRRWALNELVFDIGSRNPDSKITISKMAQSKDNLAQQLDGIRTNLGLEYVTDGYMRKDPNGTWSAGSGTGGEVLKDKEIIDVDVEVVGIFEGEGKFKGMLGGLEIIYKGQRQKCGGGKLTDKERLKYFLNPMLLIGKIVQVHGLSESEDGLLREPRFIRLREDKTEGE